MVRSSMSSTSSAQVEGQSCGQADAPMRTAVSTPRTGLFIASPPSRPESGRLYVRFLFAQPSRFYQIPADGEDQNGAENAALRLDLIGFRFRKILRDHRIGRPPAARSAES